jgi:hypothetical protein
MSALATPPSEIRPPITFPPNGGIDQSHTVLQQANIILQPSTEILQELVDPSSDIWRLINWGFVTIYWMILVDFGQIAPSIYSYSDISSAGLGSPIGIPHVSTVATIYPPANNIFINNLLFQNYFSYLQDTLLP